MSAPQPPAQRIRRQAAFETRTVLRNGEQLLVSLVLPALALLAVHFSSYPDLGSGRRIDIAVPGALALAVLSTAFTGQAIQTGFDRRYGVLRLLGTTPLGRDGLIAAKVIAAIAVVGIQTVALSALGLALGWRPHLVGIPMAVISLVLGAAVFVALAMVVAGALRAEAVLALANLLWVIFLGVGGVLIPGERYPAPLNSLIDFSPTGALGDAMRTSLAQGSVPLLPWLILIIWLAIFGWIAQRIFRWSD